MQLKFKSLVAISLVTLIALIGIQGYLIYNTYELKKKTYTMDARNAIKKVYGTKVIDSVIWLYRTDFLENLERYKDGTVDDEELLKRLKSKTEEINPLFLKLFKDGLDGEEEKYNIMFKIVLSSIDITDLSGNTKNVFSTNDDNTFLLLGDSFDSKSAININKTMWQNDYTGLDVIFKSNIYMYITDWNKAMLKELSGLLILSSLLFLFVVGLLFYSINNLMKQKRLADIKTDFINNITHELKTPLSTLSLATNTLTSEHANGNKEIADNAVKIIGRQNIRLQKLIDQVMQSSLGYQQIQLTKETFNGSIFLDELLDDYMLSIGDAGVAIERNIDDCLILIKADKFYLSTAIINLLNNAIKYGGSKLMVSYEIDREDSTHAIIVKDNGIGILPKYQNMIFEKFYRVSEKNTHNYKGLGLGLYYTKQIIQAHEGSITVESQTNIGSVFTIKIPII